MKLIEYGHYIGQEIYQLRKSIIIYIYIYYMMIYSNNITAYKSANRDL